MTDRLEPAATDGSQVRWFLAGMAQFVSVPALILMAAFVGFGGLAHAGGLSLAQSVALTGFVWALPSMVVLVGAVKAGTPLLVTMIAVALSAVRLMPMTMSLIPIIRDARTPRRVLYLCAHFTAITAWVFGMTRLPAIPRAGRAAYFLGFAVTLTVVNMGVTAVSWVASATLPPVLSAALVLLTPLYFIVSLWRAAEKAPTDRLALIFGFLVMPVATRLTPEFALLVTGLVGGSLAFFAVRAIEGRRRAAAEDAARPEEER